MEEPDVPNDVSLGIFVENYDYEGTTIFRLYQVATGNYGAWYTSNVITDTIGYNFNENDFDDSRRYTGDVTYIKYIFENNSAPFITQFALPSYGTYILSNLQRGVYLLDVVSGPSYIDSVIIAVDPWVNNGEIIKVVELRYGLKYTPTIEATITPSPTPPVPPSSP